MKNAKRFIAEIEQNRQNYEYLDVIKITETQDEILLHVEQLYDCDIEFILQTAKKFNFHVKLEAIHLDKEIDDNLETIQIKIYSAT